MINPSLVAFDLDDTLAPSKSPLPEEMRIRLAALLALRPVCVISGGQYGQFESQLLEGLAAVPTEHLARLHLMPTCGTQYFTFDDGAWRQVYAENLTDDERATTMRVLQEEAERLGLWESRTWGPILEDRQSQITFSALGQSAPVDAKKAWDPDGSKKEMLRAAVAARTPSLEVRSGGSTSVDVTRRGIDKAYGMRKLIDITGIPADEILFIGDRLDEGGNDFPVIAVGVATQAVEGWTETAEYVHRLVDSLAGAR
ncbi:HAD-IIB family hydrolase [Microcella daejeonensis]|uniref:HAD-IIB family hydrolase n=1 Tax=Microcella daejeonensis TaxID=2994971 RepID=UPI00226F4836|nr:HAD-IIB family hydrolase [Microcella daejeonensis]WAB84048.1 HAD-IIB family hydrolase [Microcella daejeonensis]